MEVMNVQTEGAIAASGGGEIPVPPEQIASFCKNSQFSAASFTHSKVVSSGGSAKQNCEQMVSGVKYFGYHKWTDTDVHFWYDTDGTFYYEKCSGGC